MAAAGADLDATNARGQTPLDRAMGTSGRVPAKSVVKGTDVSTADLLRELGERE